MLVAVATAVVFLLWHTTGHADVSRFGRSFAEMGERGFLVRVCSVRASGIEVDRFAAGGPITIRRVWVKAAIRAAIARLDAKHSLGQRTSWLQWVAEHQTVPLTRMLTPPRLF